MSKLPAFDTLQIAIVDGIARITLDRPDALNSITDAAHAELEQAFRAVSGIGPVRAIVLAANGRHFSAGGDFDEILANRADRTRRTAQREEARGLLLAICDCHLPVITALQGDAVGLGATVMAASDAVVAARGARISDPHVVIGLVAGDGGCVLWPQHAGLLRAKRYLLSGDRIDAERAYEIGLVTDLVDAPEDALPAATALAERIAALPPLAVQHTKRTLNKLLRARIEEVFDYGVCLELETFDSDDLGEAIAAFREKRQPVYTGR